MNYELQVNALRLSLFYRHCSLCLSRGYFCFVLQAKSEFNAEVNQPYEFGQKLILKATIKAALFIYMYLRQKKLITLILNNV